MMRFVVPAVMALVLAAPASASIVTNGSFEMDPGVRGNNGAIFADLANPGGANWAVWNTLPGWTAVPLGGPGIEVQTDETLGNIDAQDGEYYVELDSTANATIRQNVALVAGSYELSFWYSPRIGGANGPATNAMTYAIGGLLSGNLTGPGINPVTAVGQWTQIVVSFVVAVNGTYNLDFAARGTNDSLGALIDNVSIAAVPVPAAGGLLLLGLGGLASMRRRKTV
jgi:hypothetical protein